MRVDLDDESRVDPLHLSSQVDELFREARIEIAFPQRDVHLDAAPLEVRVLKASEPAAGDDP